MPIIRRSARSYTNLNLAPKPAWLVADLRVVLTKMLEMALSVHYNALLKKKESQRFLTKMLEMALSVHYNALLKKKESQRFDERSHFE